MWIIYSKRITLNRKLFYCNYLKSKYHYWVYSLRAVKKLIVICASVVWLMIGLFFLVPYQFQTPSPEIRYDVNGNVLIWHKQQQRTSLDQVPEHLISLVVGIEDERFRSHPWVDLKSIGRAFRLYVQGIRPVQGASTIEQQLVKLDHQQFARGRWAKITENRRAVRLEFQYSKEELLLRYLNSIPFSHSIVGRQSACQSYRGKWCDYLSDVQLLVTLTTAQLWANPYRSPDRKNIIWRATMYVRVRPDLFSESVVLSDHLVDELQSFPAPLDPRVQEVIRDQSNPWTISYDLELSSRLDTILKRTKSQRDQYMIHDCCIVVLDGDGWVVSMNICQPRAENDWSKVNSCLVPRQTWSAIKPFLYLYAFHMLWLHSTDMVVDEPVQFDLWDGNLYDPKNFDLTYHGEVTYAYALGNSLNVPAIKTLSQVGVAPFLDFLKKQIQRLAPTLPLNPKTADEVGLSLGLWTYEMSPLQFTQLWRGLLPEHTPQGYESQRRDLVEVLSNPVNKLVSFGQDSFLNTRGWAVKTGTSRKFVDGWICGVKPSLERNKKTSPQPSPSRRGGRTVCIWLGNQTNEPMLGASSEVGSYLWSLVVDAIER